MDPRVFVTGGQVSHGLTWVKKSRVEDVSLPDLEATIADLELERSQIISAGGATPTSAAPTASRLAKLDIVIDDLATLEYAVQAHLRGSGCQPPDLIHLLKMRSRSLSGTCCGYAVKVDASALFSMLAKKRHLTMADGVLDSSRAAAGMLIG